jgi:glycogen debranching enzyme
MESHLIRLRPRSDTLYISHNHTVLMTSGDGFISDAASHGLFADETRMLSRYRYLLNGQEPRTVALSAIEQHSSLGYYICGAPDIIHNSDAPAQHSIELRLSRSVGSGVHEDIDVTNFTQKFAPIRLELCADADFADFQEIGGERRQKGRLLRAWNGPNTPELIFDYTAEHHYDNQEGKGVARLHRSCAVRFVNSTSPPAYKNERIVFEFGLPPHKSWHSCVHLIPVIDGRRLEAPAKCYSFATPAGFEESHDAFAAESLSFKASPFEGPESGEMTHTVIQVLERARRDLAALRFHDTDLGPNEWTGAAGLPIYVALFGRDLMTAAWETAIVDVRLLRGTLAAAARLQGQRENDWRDEQPGKMFHEAHNSPLAVLNYNPRRCYYGSITTSAFYAAALAELWHWTGSKDLMAPLIEPAIKSLRWLDRDGDIDGDGFYEYRTRSSQGLKNQGWKDSGEAIVHESGELVADPIALADVHGFAFASKLSLSEMLWWLDRKDEALALYNSAMELKKRFNEAFWMPDEKFFAMGLDPAKRQIRSIASGAGLCLATGVVDESLARATADRLMMDDLFSGWGLRTLSSGHPAYNPYSYQRGSVWPVEQGATALGFMRCGLIAHMHRLAKAQFEAAALFDHYRAPEVFSGHQRTPEHPFPALYPATNWPQAWSASSMFTLIQAMLGIVPYAPMNVLFLDPHLPEWLPDITLRKLKIGETEISIRFVRKKNGSTDYHIVDQRGALHVLRQPSPWSLTATFAERIKDSLMSLLPAH